VRKVFFRLDPILLRGTSASALAFSTATLRASPPVGQSYPRRTCAQTVLVSIDPAGNVVT
jgi:hypothetical protein